MSEADEATAEGGEAGGRGGRPGFLLALFAVLLAGAIGGGIALLTRGYEESATPVPDAVLEIEGSGSPLGADAVVELEEVDAVELTGSSAASPTFEISPPDGSRPPYELRFSYPPELDPGTLAAATREGEDEMWTLRAGRIVGEEFVVRTDELSQWQLRDLGTKAASIFASAKVAAGELAAGVSQALSLSTRPASCGGERTDAVLAETDPEEILLAPCVEADGQRTRLKAANNLGLALEFKLSDTVEVEEISGSSLPETAWDEINRRLSSETARILPGSGQVSLSLEELPEELSFRPTTAALVADLALTLATRGKSKTANAVAGYAECVYAAAGAVGEGLGGLERALVGLFADCGQNLSGSPEVLKVAALAGLLETGRAVINVGSVRRGASATVRVDRSTVGEVAGPDELAVQGASCGRVEERFLATGSPIAVEVGPIGTSVFCGEALELVRKFITTNECVDAGNTCFLEIDGYDCLAPTLGSYPLSVRCSRGSEKIVGVAADALEPVEGLQSCGTPKRTLGGGPFEVESNVVCDGAHEIALQLAAGGCFSGECEQLPFVCEAETTGIESSRHTCRFGAVEVSFLTGA